MKKKISLLLVSILVLTLFTGCKKTNSNSSSSKDIKILLSYTKEKNNTFRDVLGENAKAYAESVGAQLDIQNPEGSIENQVEQFKQAKTNGYNAIICIAESADIARQLIAAADGLPVVFVNNCPDDNILIENKYIYVGSSEGVAGQYQAEYVLEKFKSKNEINVVLLKGLRNHSATIGRTNMFLETLNNSNKKINILFNDFADFSTDDAYSKLNIFLRLGKNTDVIACNNDAMAMGAIKALKEKNIDLSTIDIIGVDATQDGINAILSDEMKFTVYQSAAGQGKYTVKAAIALATTGSIEKVDYVDESNKYIWIPFEKVDKSNANDYK